MLTAIYLFFSLIVAGSSNYDGDWKKSLEKNGITIYTRSVEHSSFKEFLAEAQMPGTLSDFKAIITDIEKYPEWLPDCDWVTILDDKDPGKITYQLNLKVPFPFANRDIIQQISVMEYSDSLTVELINCPDKIPIEPSQRRIHEAYGYWKIVQINETEIGIEFQYFTNPGSDIPAWLANSFIVKNPYNTLTNLRKKLAK